MQINLFNKRISKSFLYLGWVLFFLYLWFKGCSNSKPALAQVKIKEVTKTLPADTIIKHQFVEVSKMIKDMKAEEKLKTDIKEMYSRLLNYQEETEWMQEEFAYKDSLQKAEAYMKSIAVKAFESNHEDDLIKLKINGILAGGEVKEITPTYTIKERTVNVPQTKFRLLAGGGIANTPNLDKPIFNANLGLQNAKGNILRLGYDSEQRIFVGYEFSIWNYKK